MHERGFLHDCTDYVKVDDMFNNGSVTAYIGFDATAKSLHVGSLIQIMMLHWLQKCGHRPIVLMGGGTTRIGDPSFRNDSRPILTEDEIKLNVNCIKEVFSKYVKFGHSPTDAVMVNNDAWLSKLSYLDFLGEIGKHFTINKMLGFDSVKNRMADGNSLSFLEFNYMIMQAYDFLHLNTTFNCSIQLGGSDQWGNIVNGIDLTRRVNGKEVFGMVSPLLTTSSGEKMGKSSTGSAVWLNEDMFSAYDFWQFWRNTQDNDVLKFMKLFTTLPIKECERIVEKDINLAKIALANHVTEMLHGKDAAFEAERKAVYMFGNGKNSIPITKTFIISKEKLGSINLKNFLVEIGLSNTSKNSRHILQDGIVKVDGDVIDIHFNLSELKNKTLISVGKRNCVQVVVESS